MNNVLKATEFISKGHAKIITSEVHHSEQIRSSSLVFFLKLLRSHREEVAAYRVPPNAHLHHATT